MIKLLHTLTLGRKLQLLFVAGAFSALIVVFAAYCFLFNYGMDRLPTVPVPEYGMTQRIVLRETVVFGTPAQARALDVLTHALLWGFAIAMAIIALYHLNQPPLALWQKSALEQKQFADFHGPGALPRLRRILLASAFIAIGLGFLPWTPSWQPPFSPQPSPAAGRVHLVLDHGTMGYTTTAGRIWLDVQDSIPFVPFFAVMELTVILDTVVVMRSEVPDWLLF